MDIETLFALLGLILYLALNALGARKRKEQQRRAAETAELPGALDAADVADDEMAAALDEIRAALGMPPARPEPPPIPVPEITAPPPAPPRELLPHRFAPPATAPLEKAPTLERKKPQRHDAHAWLHDPVAARRAFIASEVLGPPRAHRRR